MSLLVLGFGVVFGVTALFMPDGGSRDALVVLTVGCILASAVLKDRFL